MNDSMSWMPPRVAKSRLNAASISPKTLSLIHSWKRLWQVDDDGYRSGKSAHGAPVRSTHRMPFNTSRSGQRGLPRPSASTSGCGISGSRNSHCSFVMSILSIDQRSRDPSRGDQHDQQWLFRNLVFRMCSSEKEFFHAHVRIQMHKMQQRVRGIDPQPER